MATAPKRMTKAEFARKVVIYIHTGKLDTYLVSIVQAANQRRSYLHEQKKAENMVLLNVPGKRVRVIDGVRPKYLIGYAGNVVDRPPGFKGGDGVIYVDFGAPIRRYGQILGIPASSLEEADD